MANKTKDIHGLAQNEPSPNSPKGKNYLLAIGIDQYAHCPKLHNAAKDARDMVAVLKKRFQFEEEQIIELYDEKATKRSIYDSLDNLASKITDTDNFLLYFSGHGEFHKRFKLGYWVPVEAEKEAFDQYIPNSEIRNILSAIKSHHTFLMIDSCFSGALFAKGSSRNIPLRKERDPSRWGLTAGRNEIVTDGEKGTNSPFAKSLLYQLEQTDHPIGVAELCDKVLEVVSANANQTPRGEPLKVDGHQGGQFVFHLKKDEVADWKETIEKGTLAAYQSFLRKYPEGKYTNEAHAKTKTLKAETLWQKIQSTTDDQLADLKKRLVLVNQYVDQYEDQVHYDEALNVGELLEYKKDFLKSKNSDFALKRFLKKDSPNIAGAAAVRQSAKAILAKREEREEQLEAEKEKTQTEEAARLKEEEIARKKAAKEQLRKQQEASERKQREAKERQERSKKEQEKLLAKKEQPQQSRLEKEKKQKERPAAMGSGPSPKVDQSNPFKKYIKFAWVLLLIPIGWGINSLLNNDNDGNNGQRLVTENTVKKPITTENETGKEKQANQTTNASSGIVKDRAGQSYTWKRMKDGKKWMTENLNYKTSDSWCYDGSNSNCKKYGRLYTWAAAKKACPSGWHLPSDAEWRAMAKQYGGCDDDASDNGKAAYKSLISGGNSGFTALLGGYRYADGSYNRLGKYGLYWSSSEKSSDNAWHYYFDEPSSKLIRYDRNKTVGRSCRCTED